MVRLFFGTGSRKWMQRGIRMQMSPALWMETERDHLVVSPLFLSVESRKQPATKPFSTGEFSNTLFHVLTKIIHRITNRSLRQENEISPLFERSFSNNFFPNRKSNVSILLKNDNEETHGDI